jgi:hypothetical protein
MVLGLRHIFGGDQVGVKSQIMEEGKIEDVPPEFE